jgi:hypothetical protein
MHLLPIPLPDGNQFYSLMECYFYHYHPMYSGCLIVLVKNFTKSVKSKFFVSSLLFIFNTFTDKNLYKMPIQEHLSHIYYRVTQLKTFQQCLILFFEKV